MTKIRPAINGQNDNLCFIVNGSHDLNVSYFNYVSDKTVSAEEFKFTSINSDIKTSFYSTFSVLPIFETQVAA